MLPGALVGSGGRADRKADNDDDYGANGAKAVEHRNSPPGSAFSPEQAIVMKSLAGRGCKRPSSKDRSDRSRSPSTEATTCGTSSGSTTGTSETRCTPSLNELAMVAATPRASRVLPQ